jgi:hypothetical protein
MPFMMAASRRLAATHAVIDGFDHHHGIVHHHPQGDDDAEQHGEVEGGTDEVGGEKGAGQ